MDDHVGGPGSSTFMNNGSQLQHNEAGPFGRNGHISVVVAYRIPFFSTTHAMPQKMTKHSASETSPPNKAGTVSTNSSIYQSQRQRLTGKQMLSSARRQTAKRNG